ncbi:HAD family hydrolase [Actinoplanes aureus]|jgi:FMN phosphatase YigB (HAD superfamily)|uniref:HAD family hydrolase n=1 Tax=Actinoplanes aureus TaxID=2792083 RepID=A0A931FZ19_9ACTN|nr:HAD family hydrolase [Actinoplanes aureus]MBG0560039.1 HAD family hydrolase [Actinoplanes aureus]
MTPEAVLFDFGGVLADAPYRAAPPELVLRIYNLARGALTPGQIQRSLTEGGEAYARWRDEDWPDELPQAEVWERFVIGGWPPLAQVRVRGAVPRLSYDWAWREGWALRPGIPEALAALAEAGIPMAVVSNTLCGAAHRDFLAKAGVGRLFAAQIYSDEAGVRKPNPQMIWNATDKLGVSPAACWFVGDSRRRDILCARRADIGTAILMPSGRDDPADPSPWPAPDAVVTDGFALRDLL